MQTFRKQTTISGPCSVSGRGYWSGKLNTLTFLPAPANSGIRFLRKDVPHAKPISAITDNCIGMSLRTRVTDGLLEFDMVEHVMSALAGLAIDNVLIECTAGEMPGFDGSSYPIALALHNAGTRSLEASRIALSVREALQIGQGDQFVRFEPVPQATDLIVEYQLDYGPHSPIGAFTYEARLSPACYLTEIAPARTFISSQDAERLQQSGLATHVTERDLLVFGPEGPIQNQLRFPDECARHKALDLIGDLALTGFDLVGRLVARRSGHQMNGELAKLLRSELENNYGSQKHAA